ncbi:MAG: inorganic phosphate transporter, partial [Candidatus Gracilibacteria bacterium]
SIGLLIINNSIVDWYQIGKIAASWVISPVMGGIIAVMLLLSIRKNILKQDERGEAAKVWVPIYIGIMVWAFSTYLLLKGFKQILNGSNLAFLLETEIAIFIGYVLALLTFISLRIYYKKQSAIFKNGKKFINKLFNIPLIFAVALLSFAHGANDVANAIGPLAAVNDALKNHVFSGGSVGIETWIMVTGAIGLVLGLAVFGARLIQTVGSEITKLNQIRAYCVALAAAITVIIASGLGLPVSSTHIALGGIFGIGLIREAIKRQKGKDKHYIKKSMIKNIILAWLITLPASGIIASITYLIIMKLS